MDMFFHICSVEREIYWQLGRVYKYILDSFTFRTKNFNASRISSVRGPNKGHLIHVFLDLKYLAIENAQSFSLFKNFLFAKKSLLDRLMFN